VADVTSAGGATTVSLTLTSVVVNGQALGGTASFETSNGSTFTVVADITSGSTTYDANLTVTGSKASLTISGTAKETTAAGPEIVTFDDVVVTPGQCYASAGSMTVVEGKLTETVTFEASTPATGAAELTLGKHTSQITLPSYGKCPSAGRDGG
jgi:hypothetical protein